MSVKYNYECIEINYCIFRGKISKDTKVTVFLVLHVFKRHVPYRCWLFG